MNPKMATNSELQGGARAPHKTFDTILVLDFGYARLFIQRYSIALAYTSLSKGHNILTSSQVAWGARHLL